jgi:Transmembrane protein 131-like N-terminal
VKAWLIAGLGICLLTLVTACPPARGQSVPASLVISPASLDFGDHVVGSESQPVTIMISNSTKATIKIKDVLISGIDFTQSSDCGQSVPPGASCTLQVFFKPAISGQRIGNLVITGSDSGSPHFVAVVGTGK